MGKVKRIIKWIKRKILRKKKKETSGISRKFKKTFEVRESPGGVSFYVDSGCYQPNSTPPLRLEEMRNVSLI